ncbi:hypothetical protein [Actinomadura sp. HBU206391]|uniref:hypothetical protein n=1 Tax=Actinomadura sp. HBU206391 TaxID=2731692 RepID=UPI001650AC92|nr:hypothetical protein [Actinomadura sp. HBU206391]MBC6458164.1 hypothetical protein [Actinomadura sp. HBU206391]
MRPRTAALVLRLPLGDRSRLRRRALASVLRAAGSGVPAAMDAVARALRSQGREAVWRAWLNLPEPSARRWASPVLTQLLEGSPSIPDEVVNAAWRDWFDEHDATLWSLLERWRRPCSDAQRRSLSLLTLGDDAPVDTPVLIEAAVRFDHPIGERARARLPAPGEAAAVDLFCAAAVDSPDAIAFCAAHHLAPSDEVRRAVFFVRTGQHEQYRALDPDGELLALGYRSASAQERASLRAAMTTLGDIDALRVLAGRSAHRGDISSLTEQERSYLVRRLAGDGEWERLWRLTVLLPLTEAVDAVRAFGDRPSDAGDRHVFEALRAADPRTVRTCVEALSAPTLPHARFRLGDLDGRLGPPVAVDDLDFAPDGTELAFVGQFHTPATGPSEAGESPARTIFCAGIVDLESRAMTRLYSDFAHPLELVAHLGSGTLVLAEVELHARDPDRMATLLEVHYADRGDVRALGFGAGEIVALERVAGDRAFIVATLDNRTGQGTTGMVFMGDAHRSLVPTEITEGPEDFFPEAVAVGPGGRTVAVIDVAEDYVVVADLAGSVVNPLDSGPGEVWPLFAALSPSALLRCDDEGELRVWHAPFTSARPPVTLASRSSDAPPIGLAWSSTLNRFLVVYPSHAELLDVSPVRDHAMPDGPQGDLVSERIPLAAPDGSRSSAPHPLADESRFVRLSPAGDVLAVVGVNDDTIDLYALTAHTLRPVIGRPMGLMDPAVLADVVAALRNPVLDKKTRATLALLRACLEHRFRHDVGIGDAAGAVAVADDDIELGG